MTFADLVARARALAGSRDGRVLLGITGSPGAGKTTLARALVEALAPDPPAGCVPGEWVVHVPMDGFHLADATLDRLGRRSRKGAPDTFDGDGYLALLRRIRADDRSVVHAPAFDHGLGQPVAGSVPVPPAARMVVSEGNYLLLDAQPWTAVAREFDEIWFHALDDDVRRARLVDRHVRAGRPRGCAADWVREVDEPNARLVAASRDRAHLVVPTAGLDGLRPIEQR